MKQVHRILQIGKSPISGRIYPREELEELVVRFKEKETPTIAFLFDDNASTYLDLDTIVGHVEDIFLNDEGLVSIIDVFEPTTDAQKLLSELMSMESEVPLIKVSPVIIGKIDEIDGETVASRLSLEAVQFSIVSTELAKDK